MDFVYCLIINDSGTKLVVSASTVFLLTQCFNACVQYNIKTIGLF